MLISETARPAAYRKRTLKLVGRSGSRYGARSDGQLPVFGAGENASPTILDCSLSTPTSNDFEPIADEFPRLPLWLRSNLVTTLNDDLPETFAAMGWSAVYEFSDDVSL